MPQTQDNLQNMYGDIVQIYGPGRDGIVDTRYD